MRIILAPYCINLAGCIPLQIRRRRELVRKTALATTPAVLLGQAGWTPFSNYVIKPDETGVTGTGAIVSSCSSYSRFTQSCKPPGNRYLGYGLCDIIVVYSFGS